MQLKSNLQSKKFLPFIMLLLVISYTSTGLAFKSDTNPINGINQSHSLNNYRFIVKLKPEVAAQAENSLSQAEMEIRSAAPKSMYSLFHQYKLKRMAPVYKSLVLWKRQTGKAENDFFKQIKQKFSRRAGRYHGISTPPEVSRTYILEPEVNSGQEFEKMLDLLKKDPSFEYVEPDHVVTAQMTPDDPYFSSSGSWGQTFDDLYGMKKIACPQAWDLSTGLGVTVAVVDSGVDKSHPDIAANILANALEIPNNGVDDDHNGYIDDLQGWNFVNNTNNATDDHGHGTHVAGIIAAVGNNGTGVIGVAPNAKIMPVKALDSEGNGYDSWLAAGIHYAADNGADVINCSFGGQGSSQVLEEAVNYAYNLGVVIVVAAGNNNDDARKYFPAGFSNVITVAATDSNDAKAWYSNWGSKIDVAAPGDDILSLRGAGTFMGYPLGNYYTRASGTSMAAPHVSGLAALILSRHPEFTNAQIRPVLRSSAADILSPGFDSLSGYGRIDAFKALNINNTLESVIESPQSGIMATGNITVTGIAKGNNFSDYTLEYGVGSEPSSWTVYGQGNTTVNHGTLGNFNAALVPDGIYTLRLSVKDNSTPQNSFEDRIQVVVDYMSISDPAPPSVPNLAKEFKSGMTIPIRGTAVGPAFQRFRFEWAEGLTPTEWSGTGFTIENNGYTQVNNSLLGSWNSGVTPGRAGYYQLRLLVDNAGFTSETRTVIYLEPDLISANWPQKINRPFPSDASVLPARDGTGISSLVGVYSRMILDGTSFFRYAYDGSLQYSLDYDYPSYCQPVAGNLDGLPGEETVVYKIDRFRVIKPDNTFYEFLPGSSLDFRDCPIVLQDLNGDTIPEILALGTDLDTKTKYLYAWTANGTLLSNKFPIPILNNSGNDIGLTCFLVTDMDYDGRKEIIVQQSDSNLTSFLSVYGWDGTPKNWQLVQPSFLNAIIGKMIAGDFDHDGLAEFVLQTYGVTRSGSGSLTKTEDYKIYVLGYDGSIRSGWPITVPSAKVYGDFDLAISDMDQDGTDEVVVANWGYLNVLKPDGTPLSTAWPSNEIQFDKFSVGDVNGDGFPEIVIIRYATRTYSPDPLTSGLTEDLVLPRDYLEYELWIIDKNATVINKWKILGPGGIQPYVDLDPVLGDFDNNGKVDMAIAYNLGQHADAGGLSVFSLNSDYHADKMDWPMNLHDPQNSSVRTTPVIFVTGISLDTDNITVPAGLTRNVIVTATYSNGSTKNVTDSATYQMADTSIATVDAAGKITGLTPGTTSLTVSYRGKTTVTPVNVGQPALRSIGLDASNYWVMPGSTKNVAVTATYSDNSTGDVTGSAAYQIANLNIASVDSTGLITGLLQGETVLTATYQGKTATASVNVGSPVLMSIRLNQSAYTMLSGLTQNVTVTAVYSDNHTEDVTNLAIYQSGWTVIATVDAAGVITGHSPGNVGLTVTYQGKTATASITVLQPAIISIAFDSTQYTVEKGGVTYISVSGHYSDGRVADVTLSSNYQSSDPLIATINGYGMVSGLKPGTVTITAKWLELTATTQVVVQGPQLTAINLDAASYSIPAGLTGNALVTATYGDNTNEDVTGSATYQITDTNIATVNTTGMITAKQAGTTTLTVSYQGKATSAQITITALPQSIFSDEFETRNFTAGSWSNSGCDIQSSYKYGGSYGARFNSSDSLTKDLSTVGFGSIQVTYARMTMNCETDDYFIAEWYDGSQWTQLESIPGNTGWTVKTFILPAGANNNANFKLRFRTSHNGTSDYAYLDSVEIKGTGL